MTALRFPVAVIVERKAVANRWISERWDPVSVQQDGGPGSPATASPVGAAGSQWRFGGLSIELHPSEAEGYFLNSTSAEPKAFVKVRPRDDGACPPIGPDAVSVSYNEAARWLDGGERVDAVPIPPAILDALRPFVAEHYKAEPRRKVRRNDPFAADGAGDRGGSAR